MLPFLRTSFAGSRCSRVFSILEERHDERNSTSDGGVARPRAHGLRTRAVGAVFTITARVIADAAPPTLPQPPLTVHNWLPGVVFDSNTTLSGFVFERAQGVEVPIERAWVYCERCGEETHAGMWTDKQGFYSFQGVWGYAFPISVSKDDSHNRVWRDVILNGNTRFDVQLERK